ncbi:hypothetical protein LCGC14_0288540 [marine sediment metagenome]|uniref:Uncharacterized protein n=1 Tax=marine sediment metagenome TaxID=412755 RepID=A0A0F9UAN8_9ZZZZ
MNDEEYRELARSQYAHDGEIEIDSDANVSRAHDHPPEDSARCHNADEDGAYVQAWVWVSVDNAASSEEPCPCGRPGPVLHMVGETCCR